MSFEIALRPPRKCSTAGEGIVIFGTTWAVSACFFRKQKWSSIGCSAGKSSLPITRTASWRVSTPANWMPVSGWNSSQPVSLARKSKCHQERRNSPSVASFRPIEACLCTTFSISMSSILRRSSAEISPFCSLARASLIFCGLSRLPTSSARKGALVLCMVSLPISQCAVISVCGGAGHAEMALQHRGIGLQRLAWRVVHDGAAFQYHNAVGQPQNLLRILLDNDRADAGGAGNAADRLQKLLDNDRGKPLGRLIQQQDLGIEGERAADRQHLLLAAGKLVTEIAAAFLQPRKHLVDFLDRPRARLGHRGHVLFH